MPHFPPNGGIGFQSEPLILPLAVITDSSQRVDPRNFRGVGDGVTDDHVALGLAIASMSAGQTLDLAGRTWATTTTISFNVAGITVQNGSITCATAATSAVQVLAANVKFRNVAITASTSRGTAWNATSAQLSACVVNAAGFKSFDCDYSGGYLSALFFANGNCTGSQVKGGSATTSSLVQNASAIQAAPGPTGNERIVVDGVEITGSNGVLLFDGRNCRVKDCHVSSCTRMPTLTVSNGGGSSHGSTALWTLVSGTTWRARLASGTTPGTDGPTTDRNDGNTRVLKLDAAQVSGATGGGAYNSTDTPNPGTWGFLGGYIFYNTSGTSFTDPNNHTFTSDVVSGYGITLYHSANGFTDPSGNAFSGNRVELCDGFGIYMQAGNGNGTPGTNSYGSGNSTRDNDLTDCCLQGIQDVQLPFAAIGWNGGIDSKMSGDTILATTTITAPGVSIVPGSGIYLSSGRAVGVTVDGSHSQGFAHNADGGWTLADCNAKNTTSYGFRIWATPSQTTRSVYLLGCNTLNAGSQGIFIDASAAGSVVQADILGGTHRGAANCSVYVNGARETKVMGINSLSPGRVASGQAHVRFTANANHCFVGGGNHFVAGGSGIVMVQIDAGCTDCGLDHNWGSSTPGNLVLGAGVVVRTGGTTGGPLNFIGSGVPTAGGNNVTAPIGSTYVNTTGAAASIFYVNQTGLPAGWLALA